MDNIELEQKILDIIQEDNYFEMVMKAKEFEPEYKKSDFYKVTKKPLGEVIKESKIYYALQLKDFGRWVQEVIDNLSLEKITLLLDKAGDVFQQENEELAQTLGVFKDLNN